MLPASDLCPMVVLVETPARMMAQMARTGLQVGMRRHRLIVHIWRVGRRLRQVGGTQT